MLLRRPSSLPISASVVALKPLRAKHLAAAERIAATRGFSQSTARGAGDFSSLLLSTWGLTSVVPFIIALAGPAGRLLVHLKTAGELLSARPNVSRSLCWTRAFCSPYHASSRPWRYFGRTTSLGASRGEWAQIAKIIAERASRPIEKKSTADTGPSARLRGGLP